MESDRLVTIDLTVGGRGSGFNSLLSLRDAVDIFFRDSRHYFFLQKLFFRHKVLSEYGFLLISETGMFFHRIFFSE